MDFAKSPLTVQPHSTSPRAGKAAAPAAEALPPLVLICCGEAALEGRTMERRGANDPAPIAREPLAERRQEETKAQRCAHTQPHADEAGSGEQASVSASGESSTAYPNLSDPRCHPRRVRAADAGSQRLRGIRDPRRCADARGASVVVARAGTDGADAATPCRVHAWLPSDQESVPSH